MACVAILTNSIRPESDPRKKASNFFIHSLDSNEYPDVEIDTVLEAAIADSDAATDVASLFSTGLGRGGINPAHYNLETMRAAAALDGDWEFWARWYEGFLDGRPLPWDLQERIALIPEEEWRRGPKRIAEIIAEIEARHRVRKAKDALERDLRIAETDRRGLGGNFPPERIEDPAALGRNLEIIWAPLEIIGEELVAGAPDKSRLKTAIEMLESASVEIAKWVGRKADLLVNTAIVTGVPSAAAYAGANPEKISALIEALRVWLPLI